MSEEREKKDDSQPDTGLPRVQDRRQVRAGEGGGGRARQRGGPHDAASGAAGQPQPGLVPPRRPSAAAARPGELTGLREPQRTGREPEGDGAERRVASRRVAWGPPSAGSAVGGRGGSRPRAERCPRCSVERDREGPRSLGVSPRLLLQAGGWEFTLSVTCGSASGQRRQPQPPLLPHLRQARMPAAAPWRAAASSNARKLPALQAAASCTPSARGSARAMGIRGSRLPVLAPRPQQPPEMPCSCNVCSANSVSVPRLLVPQAADDGASASNTARGKLGVRSATSRAEGQVPASGGAGTRDVGVQTEPQVLEETAERESTGQSSDTLQAASLSPSDEAHAVCSPSLLDAGPGPAGHLEPLPASVLEDAESSDAPEAARSAEEADGASLLLSVSEGGEREEPAVAMPESSGQGLAEARRLQDPREINRETYGYSPVIPALRRIREEDRNERMLSHWNISWPRNTQRLQARGDAFNTAGTVQGMPGIRPTTSRAAVRFPDSGDSRVWSPRLSVVQEESSDDSNSAASTTEGMLDARDTAMTDKGMHPPSCLGPSALEAVEEDWECDSEEDAAAEAVSVTPSASDDSSAEVESMSSASSVAADPRPEEHVSACEGADVGPQHEVSAETGERAQSSVGLRDTPEDGPGTAAAPHAMARRRMPAVIWIALWALRRVFTCSCIRGQDSERRGTRLQPPGSSRR
eukprot:XP_025008936.1 transcription initiation factor TFIID subunit 4-like [Gallus gallus]